MNGVCGVVVRVLFVAVVGVEPESSADESLEKSSRDSLGRRGGGAEPGFLVREDAWSCRGGPTPDMMRGSIGNRAELESSRPGRESQV